jgi:hypothetical protein
MPNSRVRALTENASTPATPTTAIANATAANTPNTSEFKRSGVSEGDYHELGVIGWATAWDYIQPNPDVVAYLLAHGARHNIFSRSLWEKQR